MFLLCKEGTEETPNKNIPRGFPLGIFLIRVLLVLFLQEKKTKPLGIVLPFYRGTHLSLD